MRAVHSCSDIKNSATCQENSPDRRGGYSRLTASMRPGHCCPGKCRVKTAKDDISVASFNEAGALLPRKMLCVARKKRAPLRFNEAGALLPRKIGAPVSQRLDCSASFNEAGALLPRKITARLQIGNRDLAASMRPGHCCPGKLRGGAASNCYPTCFNEAGALLPRKIMMACAVGMKHCMPLQ